MICIILVFFSMIFHILSILKVQYSFSKFSKRYLPLLYSIFHSYHKLIILQSRVWIIRNHFFLSLIKTFLSATPVLTSRLTILYKLCIYSISEAICGEITTHWSLRVSYCDFVYITSLLSNNNPRGIYSLQNSAL